MSETLRDLVVSLSLNSDNFTRNGLRGIFRRQYPQDADSDGGGGSQREKVAKNGRFHAPTKCSIQGRLPDAEDHPKRRWDGQDEESRRAGAVLPGGASYAADSSGGV